MEKRKFGKRNHVKLDPLSYNICLLGESKVGKTTLIKEVCEKLVGEDGYIFFECDKEHGADAIEGIIYEDVISWQEPDRMQDENGEDIIDGVGFEEICEDIIENKTTSYPSLRTVVIDTYDQLITLAEAEALRLWNKENPDKPAKTLNSAWNGFGKGEKKAIEIMFNMFEKLRRVGVSTIIIGHVKTKDVTDTVTGESYQILTSDQQQNYFNALKKNLHFLGLAYIDREIAREKTGKKNVVTKKEEVKGKIKGEARKIKFRDDSFCIDSGSRFADIVDEIPLDADAFIKAIEDAILNEQKKSGKSLEDTKAEQDKANAKREKLIAEKEERDRVKKEMENSLSEAIEKITEYIKDNKADLDKIKPILAKSKELGYNNPLQIDKVNDAKIILKMIEE